MHEDVLMRLFVFSLEGDPRAWIKNYCRPRETSSLTGLIQVFLKNWDPTYEEDQDNMMMRILVNHLVTPLKTMYIKRLLMKRALKLPCHRLMKSRVW